MRFMISSFILTAIMICVGCTNDEQPEVKAPEGPSKEEIRFRALSSQIYALEELPFQINEVDLQFINHKDFRILPVDSIRSFIQPINEHANYYLVNKPVENPEFTALVILESELDTLFNASERFFLYTYSREGKVLSKILFAASVSNENHYRTTGALYPDFNISVMKYEYIFNQGGWDKVPDPIKSLYYEIDSTGKITDIHSEINREKDSVALDIMSSIH